MNKSLDAEIHLLLAVFYVYTIIAFEITRGSIHSALAVRRPNSFCSHREHLVDL